MLLNAGADANAKDNANAVDIDGDSALILAASESILENDKIVSMLTDNFNKNTLILNKYESSG